MGVEVEMKELIYKLFIQETKDTKLQFFRYIFVGGFAAVINFGLLFVMTKFAHMYYLLSNIIGFVGGLITNYILSTKLIFKVEKSINRFAEFTIYAIIGVIGLGLDTLFMFLLTDKMHIYYMISKIVSTAVVFIWNFGGRKLLYVIIEKLK